MQFYIESIALAAPGLASWEEAKPILRGEKAYQYIDTAIPQPSFLPPRERRRASRTVKVSLSVAQLAQQQSNIAAQKLQNIFVSSNGDVDIFDYLCRELAMDDPAISPTKFHHSLHNSAAGYWAISMDSKLNSSSITAGDMSFSAGLLEAALQTLEKQPVLLVIYDLDPAPPMDVCNPTFAWMGVAMVLSPEKSIHSLTECNVEIVSSIKKADKMSDPLLEAFRLGNPAAASLPLLQTLACNQNREIIFDYFSSQKIKLSLKTISASTVMTGSKEK